MSCAWVIAIVADLREKKMLTAILILTIFNTGLILVIGLGGFTALQDLIRKVHKHTLAHIDDRTETAVTAIYNMNSLKQKAEMSGKAEL